MARWGMLLQERNMMLRAIAIPFSILSILPHGVTPKQPIRASNRVFGFPSMSTVNS